MARQWCKHYRGMHEKDTCEAGVSFRDLPGHGVKGFFDSCPCFGPSSGCDKAEYPTVEEMAADDERCRIRIEQVGKARAAIVNHLGGQWKKGTPGASGEIDCPACGGSKSLRFSRAGYNGHIHATCVTDGCVRWME